MVVPNCAEYGHHFFKTEKKRGFIENKETQNLNIKYDEYDEEKEKNLQKMYGAIHQLNEIDKALIFYYLQDFSGKEMAEQLGLSEGNARIKLNRAKNKLKELLT